MERGRCGLCDEEWSPFKSTSRPVLEEVNHIRRFQDKRGEKLQPQYAYAQVLTPPISQEKNEAANPLIHGFNSINQKLAGAQSTANPVNINLEILQNLGNTTSEQMSALSEAFADYSENSGSSKTSTIKDELVDLEASKESKGTSGVSPAHRRLSSASTAHEHPNPGLSTTQENEQKVRNSQEVEIFLPASKFHGILDVTNEIDTELSPRLLFTSPPFTSDTPYDGHAKGVISSISWDIMIDSSKGTKKVGHASANITSPSAAYGLGMFPQEPLQLYVQKTQKTRPVPGLFNAHKANDRVLDALSAFCAVLRGEKDKMSSGGMESLVRMIKDRVDSESPTRSHHIWKHCCSTRSSIQNGH